MMTGTRLYVCETCVRDLAIDVGMKTRGRFLADAIARELRARRKNPALIYRTVLCLNGCPRPCNIALRAPGKYSYRLGRLTAADAKHVVDFLHEYCNSSDGNVPPERLPSALRDKVSVKTSPLGRTVDPITTSPHCATCANREETR